MVSSHWCINIDIPSRSRAGSITAEEVVCVVVVLGWLDVPLCVTGVVVVVVSVTLRPVPLHL
jgi:hypothetical protein